MKESKIGNEELVDLNPPEQEELVRLCQDAYDKSYDRLVKSKDLILS